MRKRARDGRARAPTYFHVAFGRIPTTDGIRGSDVVIFRALELNVEHESFVLLDLRVSRRRNHATGS